MLYAIMNQQAPGSHERRVNAREEHLRYVKALQSDGRLVLAGPHPAIDSPDPGPEGFSGNLIVAEFDSMEDAEAWVRQDPYTKAGVYAGTTVKPFIQVLP